MIEKAHDTRYLAESENAKDQLGTFYAFGISVSLITIAISKHCFFKFPIGNWKFGAIHAEICMVDPISVANCRGNCVCLLTKKWYKNVRTTNA